MRNWDDFWFEKEFVRGKALAAASPIPERSVMVGYSILTNLLSRAIVIRFSPKPTFIAYCPYLSPALSSPVIILLRIPQSAPISLVLSQKAPSLTPCSPSHSSGTQSILAGTWASCLKVNYPAGWTTTVWPGWKREVTLLGICTVSHGRCRSMMFGRMGRYRLDRVFLLRIFLCWDWLIPRVYPFTLLFPVYLIISISLLCSRVLRPITADPSGGGMPSKCQSRHLDKKMKPLGLYLGGV